jgi:hypothetical protein
MEFLIVILGFLAVTVFLLLLFEQSAVNHHARKVPPWVANIEEKLPDLMAFAGTPPEKCGTSKLANQRDFASVWMRDFLKDAKKQ